MNIVKISDKELWDLAPLKVECSVQTLRDHGYDWVECKGEIRRGGANNVLLYPFKEYVGKLDTQIQISHHTSNVCNSKQVIFRVGCGEEVIINKLIKSNIMNTIKDTIKSLLRTEPERSFIKVGFLDESENITQMGREALEYILWENNKDELKKLAYKLPNDGKDAPLA